MKNKLQQITRKLTLYPVGLYLGLTNKRYVRSHRITDSNTYLWIDTVGANWIAEKVRKSEMSDHKSKLEVTVI